MELVTSAVAPGGGRTSRDRRLCHREVLLMTLGMSRNNPWNLLPEHVPWFGLAAAQPDQGPLAFETLTDGIRAGVRLCYTYQERALNTIRTFIPEFSPAFAGNPVEQYMANVSQWTGFSLDQVLDFHDNATMNKWAPAIWRQEQGENNGITLDDLNAGIAMAHGEEA